MNRAVGDVRELAAARVVFGGTDALAPGPGVASGKAGCARVDWSVSLLGPCSAALVMGTVRRTRPLSGERRAGWDGRCGRGPSTCQAQVLPSLPESVPAAVGGDCSLPVSHTCLAALDLRAQLWPLPPPPRPPVPGRFQLSQKSPETPLR